ncbi:Uncharacterised protein [Serratia fonticola]|uniref:Uncharacterized protein n=1 Tax=Serratia fonticola TaxID=47917 RepID=A0A4U9TYE9_SERFO|nr:Uncharacterised protein [Serratia fonticola]
MQPKVQQLEQDHRQRKTVLPLFLFLWHLAGFLEFRGQILCGKLPGREALAAPSMLKPIAIQQRNVQAFPDKSAG